MVFKKGNIPWSKGKKDWNKYKHHSKEIRDKIRLSKLGEKNPMFGKKQSEEHRRKISEGNRGKKRTEELKKLMSEKYKGRYFSKETRNKISLANTGKHPSEETRINMSKSHLGHVTEFIKSDKNPMKSEKNKELMSIRNSGEKCYFWCGGKSFEPYDKKFNDRFKKEIRKRDNQVCMLCGIHREKLSRSLNVHHINYDKLLSIPENCICLCNICHSKTHFNREHWIRFFQSLLSERYNYSYSE